MENEICAVCLDPFRDPVALPCEHNFCRECLQLFADHSRTVKNENDIISPDSDRDSQVTFLCPECLAPTNLGRRGVAGLPVNSEMVIKLGHTIEGDACRPTSTSHAVSPLCSMCDGERPAVQFCSTCEVLYCDQCLPVMHPVKGPLKRHSMISVSEYLDGRKAGVAVPKAVRASLTSVMRNPANCESRFSCEKHSLMSSDIEAEFQTLAAPLKEQTAVFEDLITKLKKCVAETVTLKRDIQANQDCHLGEVDRAYNRVQEALESWKRKEVRDVEERHNKWFSVCDEGIKHLQIKIDEGKTLISRTNHLLSTPKAEYIRKR